MLINRITELRIFAYRVKVSGIRVLSAVMTYRCYAECAAIRACPYHIRSAELLKDVFGLDCHDVGIKVNILKVLAPFN